MLHLTSSQHAPPSSPCRLFPIHCCMCTALCTRQMWRYEGSRTLSYYLRRRDTLRALATDLEVAEEAALATVMKQLCECLAVGGAR